MKNNRNHPCNVETYYFLKKPSGENNVKFFRNIDKCTI